MTKQLALTGFLVQLAASSNASWLLFFFFLNYKFLRSENVHHGNKAMGQMKKQKQTKKYLGPWKQGPWLTILNHPQYPAHIRCLTDTAFNDYHWILDPRGRVPPLLADVYVRFPPRYRLQSISHEDRYFMFLAPIALPSFYFFSAMRLSPTDCLGTSHFNAPPLNNHPFLLLSLIMGSSPVCRINDFRTWLYLSPISFHASFNSVYFSLPC